VIESLSSSRSKSGCAVHTQVKRVSASQVDELYLNLCPIEQATSSTQAVALYQSATEILSQHKAHILSERIFAGPESIAALEQAREEYLGNINDGVPATTLTAPAPGDTQIAGIQIHAITGKVVPKPLYFQDIIVGRTYEQDGRRWVFLSGLTAAQGESREAQARGVYELAARILHSCDMTFRHVARTWVWIRNILDWYDQFNAARTTIYRQENLVDNCGHTQYLPASTGIGVAPTDGSACTLDLIAISDGDQSIRFFQSSQDQNSAFSYGSAFARAVTAPMPSGSALLVSGTAAIDQNGITEHPGDIQNQINATIQHIRTLMNEAGWSESQITSAIAYSKTPQVAHIFSDEWSELNWPRVEMIADVCRDDLLFEMEVTAARSETQ